MEAVKSRDVLKVLVLEGNTMGVEAAKLIGEALSKHKEFQVKVYFRIITHGCLWRHGHHIGTELFLFFCFIHSSKGHFIAVNITTLFGYITYMFYIGDNIYQGPNITGSWLLVTPTCNNSRNSAL